ncbi:hypothetical protein QEN19_004196 [Hanseniaspora menglaensis]
MLRIDNNSLLLLVFFVFFVLLPSDNNSNNTGPSTLYEQVQLQRLYELYTNELNVLNSTAYKEPLKNITGFLYTLDDLDVNKVDYNTSLQPGNSSLDIWYGYPIPGKDYEYKYDVIKSRNNFLPETVLNTIFGSEDDKSRAIWLDDNNEESHYPKNITSTTLRGFLENSDSFDNNFIHMPLPNYYIIQQNETSPIPDLGSFFLNDTFTISNNHSTNAELGGEEKLKIDVLDFISYELSNDKTNHLAFYSATVSLASAHLIPTVSDLLLCYDLRNGRLFGVTNSAKFHGLFAIPALMATNEQIYETYKANVLNLVKEQYLNENITMDSIMIMNERARNPEFLFYAQLAKVADSVNALPDAEFKNIYNEDKSVTLESIMVYSPDTARSYYTLKPSFSGTLGSYLPIKIKYDSMKYITLPFAIFMGVFLWQISMLNSPSELNKLSSTTLKMISFSDSLAGVVFLIIGIAFSNHKNGQFSWFLVNSALFVIMGAFFELRVLVLTLQSQFLERSFSIQTLFQRFHRESGEEGVEEPPITTTGGEDSSILLPKLQGQLFFQLFMSAFAIIIVYSSATIVRHSVVNIIVLIQSFLLWPQIFRLGLLDYSAGASSLSFFFISTLALTRTIPIFYFYYKEDNLFQHSTSHLVFAVYGFNIGLQVCILGAQLKYGGRSILPDYLISILEKAMNIGASDSSNKYDYHRKVSEEELESMGKKNIYVCPICMDDENVMHLHVKQNSGDETTESVTLNTDHVNALDDKEYMITPCNHVYHVECLTYWMNNKLVCPVCRSNLPPL